MFYAIGAAMLIIAGISALVVGIESALRNGGEGMLFGIGMGALSVVPSSIGAMMLGAQPWLVLTVAGWALALCLLLLAALSIAMIVTGEEGGLVMIGLSLALSAALYAVAPPYIESIRHPATVTTTSAVGASQFTEKYA